MFFSSEREPPDLPYCFRWEGCGSLSNPLFLRKSFRFCRDTALLHSNVSMGDNGRPPAKSTRRARSVDTPASLATGEAGAWWGVSFLDSFLQTFPFWYFHLLLSCQSQVTCYPFLLATTCFLFVLMFDRRCTAVGTCPEEAWRTLWKPTNFSENLTPSSKSNATVIISRRWHCFQSGLSFPTTKPIDLEVPSSSLQKEVALILFSNTKFC